MMKKERAKEVGKKIEEEYPNVEVEFKDEYMDIYHTNSMTKHTLIYSDVSEVVGTAMDGYTFVGDEFAYYISENRFSLTTGDTDEVEIKHGRPERLDAGKARNPEFLASARGWILSKGKEQVYADPRKDVYLAVMVYNDEASQEDIDDIVNGVSFLWDSEDSDYLETDFRVITDEEEKQEIREEISDLSGEAVLKNFEEKWSIDELEETDFECPNCGEENIFEGSDWRECHNCYKWWLI